MVVAEEKALLVEVVPLTGINRALVYRIPESYEKIISVGFLVSVPLLNRTHLGVVVRLGSDQEVPLARIKYMVKVLYGRPLLSPELVKLSSWLGRYYAASIESVYEAMIPAAIRQGVAPKKQIYLAVQNHLTEEDCRKLYKKAPKQALLYEYLSKQAEPSVKSKVLKKLNIGPSSCKALVKQGVLKETHTQVQRVAYEDVLGEAETVVSEEILLTDEQTAAVDSISESLNTGSFAVHLLHGVTGSGKTEVYLQAVEKVIKEGGSALFLVSEVALTPQTVGRLRSRFHRKGIDVLVWHSHLSEGERFDAWMAMLDGKARIIVGARSAVFAPMQDLRLIIVDEEHDSAYKQSETPRYHGRDVAVYRAKLSNAVCVLGSATPSLESLNNVQIKGYKLNELKKRVDDRQLPLVHIVDMKREMLHSRGPVLLSRMLLNKLRDRFEAGEQSILFLNRRGYMSSMLCPDCGFVMECPECSVTLTHHRTDERLRCHLCGHDQKAVKKCPACQSEKIRWRSSGTQRVEDVVQQVMPKAKIVRMDADAISKKNLFREILADFRRGKIDIIVGTQMIAKGLDFPNVTFVGLVDADLSLHVQDFRASERTFQLIVQVAGRAGRGDRAGEVVIQSFAPFSAPIQFARQNDFEGFILEELSQRKEFQYPPYRHIVRHLIRGKNNEKVAFYAEKWANLLRKHLDDSVEIRGPAPAPLERIKGYYRHHVWFFMGNVSKMLPKILALREQFPMYKDIIDVFDVDPTDLC